MLSGESCGSVQVLGGVSCALADGTPVKLIGKRSRELVAALALGGAEPVPRDQISGRLWPDCTARNARKALNTELWRFRRALRDAGADPDQWIAPDPEMLALARDGGPRIDLADLLEQAENNAPAIEGSAVISLYPGPFAAGLDGEWIEAERRRLQSVFSNLLRRTAEAWLQSDRLSDAITVTEALVRDDPLDEEARRMLLTLQIRNGNRAMALREYSELESVLRSELGVEPSPETRSIRDLCFQDDGERHFVIEPEERTFRIETDPGADPATLTERLARLRAALDGVMTEVSAIEDLISQDA